MTFCLLNEQEFLAHCDRVKEKSFFQSSQMMALLNKRGYDVQLVGYRNEQSEIVVSAVLFCLPMTGGVYMEINSGPVVTDASYVPAFYQALKEYAKDERVLELVVKPYQTYQIFDSYGHPTGPENLQLIETLEKCGFQHDGLQTGYPNGEPVWHYVKDLEGETIEQLRASYTKKGQTLAKKTASFGIKVRKLQRDQLPLFKKITGASAERRGYLDKTLEYYQDLYDSFGDACEFTVATINFLDYLANLTNRQEELADQIAKLDEQLVLHPKSIKKQNQRRELGEQFDTFTVRLKEAAHYLNEYGPTDIVLAGSLFIYTQQEVVYLFSGSYPEFNKFYAPVVLQEYVMLEAIKRGLSFYNFLGIQGIFDGSDGVLRFKQNFNGYILRKAGTFRYFPRPLKYKVLQLIKSIVK